MFESLTKVLRKLNFLNQENFQQKMQKKAEEYAALPEVPPEEVISATLTVETVEQQFSKGIIHDWMTLSLCGSKEYRSKDFSVMCHSKAGIETERFKTSLRLCGQALEWMEKDVVEYELDSSDVGVLTVQEKVAAKLDKRKK